MGNSFKIEFKLKILANSSSSRKLTQNRVGIENLLKVEILSRNWLEIDNSFKNDYKSKNYLKSNLRRKLMKIEFESKVH